MDGIDDRCIAPESGNGNNERTNQVGKYAGTIEVIVLRCYPSKPSDRPMSIPPSTKSSGSSRRSSYMDDQEVPLMTGALFDGAGDSPPPRLHSRSYRSRADKEAQHHGSTGSYTPDMTWGTGRTTHHEERGRPGGTHTWAPGLPSGKDDSAAFSTDDPRQKRHGSVRNTPHLNRHPNSTQKRAWAVGAKDDGTQEEPPWDTNNDWNDGNWNTTASDNNNQQNSAWVGADHDDNEDQDGQHHQADNGRGIGTQQNTGFNRTPSVKLPTPARTASRAPSGTSLKSALKSPFRSRSRTQASPGLATDGVINLVKPLPGSWSPSLEKKEETRSESTNRRAAALNAERAKTRAAEADASSLSAGTQRSKAATPLPTVNPNPILKPKTATPLVVTSKGYQTQRERPTTVANDVVKPVGLAEDPGPVHETRPVPSATYAHKTCAPHYMDTIADPYARFIFHYRPMAVVSKMCNIRIFETSEELQSRLASLTKEELLQLLVEERMATAEAEADENLTWKTTPGNAGYEPNLDSANQRLDDWAGAGDGGGGDEGWDNSGHSGTDAGNFNNAGQDYNNQDGGSWDDGNNDNQADGQPADDRGSGNGNGNMGESAGWDNSNDQSNLSGGGSGGGDGDMKW